MSNWQTVWRGTLDDQEHSFVWQPETDALRLWCNDLGGRDPVWQRSDGKPWPEQSDHAKACELATIAIGQIKSGFWRPDQPWRMRDTTRAWVIATTDSMVMRAARQWVTVIASANLLWVSEIDGERTKRRNWTVKDALDGRITDLPPLLAADLVWRRRQGSATHAT